MKKVVAASLISLVSQDVSASPEANPVRVKISKYSDEAIAYQHKKDVIEKNYLACINVSYMDKIHASYSGNYKNYVPSYANFFEGKTYRQSMPRHRYVNYECNGGIDLEIPNKAFKDFVDNSKHKCASDEVLLVSDEPVTNCFEVSFDIKSTIIEL